MWQQRQIAYLIARNFKRKSIVKFSNCSWISVRMSSNTNLENEQKATGTTSIIAISQMRSTNDKNLAMQQVETLINKAREANATFLFLPECCDFVGENRNETLQMSEPSNGKTMQRYQYLAKENNMWLSLGGIHERIEKKDSTTNTPNPTDMIYNSHVIINNKGDVVAVYRKLHMFDVETPEFHFQESQVVKPGPELLLPVQTPIGLLGMQICYDIRFAEPSILLRKAGAQILTYPSAFSYSTGKAHWDILLRARAIENQCYVLAPAQVGYHNKKRRSWGHAMAVSPWGNILADCGPDEEVTVAVIDIDFKKIDSIRANMPCFQHRRGDIYSLTVLDTGKVNAQQDKMFAKNIIKKETIFYESEHCYAFTNLRCVVKGHVLVATKRVVPRLNGLKCEEITDLFATVCKIQRMLESIYKTTAATVTVQDGSDAGQTVPHVHFHVMPRRPGDFGYNDQIYTKLDSQCEYQPERNISDRIAEAQMYRDVLKNYRCPD